MITNNLTTYLITLNVDVYFYKKGILNETKTSPLSLQTVRKQSRNPHQSRKFYLVAFRISVKPIILGYYTFFKSPFSTQR